MRYALGRHHDLGSRQAVFGGRASQPMAAPEARLLRALAPGAPGARIAELWQEARQLVEV